MTRWKNNKLDLGTLGVLIICGPTSHHWAWQPLDWHSLRVVHGPYKRPKRSAESWLKRALRQATKRLEVKCG